MLPNSIYTAGIVANGALDRKLWIKATSETTSQHPPVPRIGQLLTYFALSQKYFSIVAEVVFIGWLG